MANKPKSPCPSPAARRAAETMRTYRKWTDKEVAELQKLWPSNISDYELAEHLGRSRGPMRKKAEAIGLKPRGWHRQRAA